MKRALPFLGLFLVGLLCSGDCACERQESPTAPTRMEAHPWPVSEIDLAIGVLKAWPAPMGRITVWLQIQNVGTGWEPNPGCYVLLSIDGPTVTEQYEVGPYPVPAPGGHRDWLYQIPFTEPLPHVLKVWLDCRGLILEPDEENNIGTCGIYYPGGGE